MPRARDAAPAVENRALARDDVTREDVAVAIYFHDDAPRFAVAAQTAAADFEGAQTLLKAFLEGAANAHGFADGFHLRTQRGVGLREFLEGEARDFHDREVNCRLEAGGRFAGDVVADFVEQVADGDALGPAVRNYVGSSSWTGGPAMGSIADIQ